MNIEMNTIRLLGAVQLIVIVGSVITDRLLASAIGSGSISEVLVNISENLAQLRISNLVAWGGSIVIIVWGVLYYLVFDNEFKIISLVALGLFVAAAVISAVSKIGANGLIALSQKFVEAGEPESSYFQTMGDFLYYGVDRQGYHLQMLFTTIGLILWNYLFYVTRYIPRWLSVWGLVAIIMFLIAVLLVLYRRDFRDSPVMLLTLAYAPY
ncbi:MAG: DUF4386 domain-containing protein [Chloroflexota bacterium]|nr:MAG: DUF4386 domain-containing protein [Chloroflexota bacterium]